MRTASCTSGSRTKPVRIEPVSPTLEVTLNTVEPGVVVVAVAITPLIIGAPFLIVTCAPEWALGLLRKFSATLETELASHRAHEHRGEDNHDGTTLNIDSCTAVDREHIVTFTVANRRDEPVLLATGRALVTTSDDEEIEGPDENIEQQLGPGASATFTTKIPADKTDADLASVCIWVSARRVPRRREKALLHAHLDIDRIRAAGCERCAKLRGDIAELSRH